jgi:hypothetical protein
MELSNEQLAKVFQLAFGGYKLLDEHLEPVKQVLAASDVETATAVLRDAGWASPRPAAELIRAAAGHYAAAGREQGLRELLLEWVCWVDRSRMTRTDPAVLDELRARTLAAIGDAVGSNGKG